ncbi:very short patch repair endonuclease [Burkholderia thailandensis]
MRRIRSRDTAPEWIVRRTLWRMGYRYRLHVKSLPGTPDIVFARRRKAVFVHGCFWHQHGCSLTNLPKTNIISSTIAVPGEYYRRGRRRAPSRRHRRLHPAIP